MGIVSPVVCPSFSGPWKYMERPHADTDALRASVREHVSRGVDQIKLYSRLVLEND